MSTTSASADGSCRVCRTWKPSWAKAAAKLTVRLATPQAVPSDGQTCTMRGRRGGDHHGCRKSDEANRGPAEGPESRHYHKKFLFETPKTKKARCRNVRQRALGIPPLGWLYTIPNCFPLCSTTPGLIASRPGKRRRSGEQESQVSR